MTTTHDPVAVLDAMRPETPVDPDALHRTRALVMSRTIAHDGSDGPAGVRRRPVRRRRALAVAACLAAATVAAVAISQTATAPPAAATPPMLPYATDVTAVADGTAEDGTGTADALAAAAAAQDAGPQLTNVSIVESAYWNLDVVRESEDSEDYRIVVVPVERTTWASAVDGSMRFREVTGTPMDEDGTIELPDVEPSGPAVLDYTLPADHDRGSIHADTLPTEPGALTDAVVGGSRPPHGCEESPTSGVADCLADAFTSLAYIAPMSPELQAAFWAAIGMQDGVYTLGTTTDRLGRTGVTLAYLGPEGTLDVLIADADTGALLGSESIDIAGEMTESHEPTVFWMQVFQPARWVADFDSV